jgi:hypothetical protein
MATGNGSTQLRRYNVRTDKGRWLATIVIADDGYFSTVSDYGNYAYWWTGAEMEFRAFLAKLDADYIIGKLKPGHEYDGDETLKSVKKRICEDRRKLRIDCVKAREEWELLDEHSDLSDRDSFVLWMQETKLEDIWGISATMRDPQASMFAERVWPVFAAMLRAELAAEKTAAQPAQAVSL